MTWLEERRTLAADSEHALFVSPSGRRMSIRSVQRLVVKLRQAMGTAKRVTPHTFRHTCATLALTMGTDLSTVSDLLRHADLNVTRRYLHLVDKRRREAVCRLEVALPSDVVSAARDEAMVREHDNVLKVSPHAATSPNAKACTGATMGSAEGESVHGRTSAAGENVLDVQQRLDDAA